MKILYIVSAGGNSLYGGRYELYGRYMTFGQQSFIYDLVVELAKRGEDVTLAVENLEKFPLTQPLAKYCRVIDPAEQAIPDSVDLLLVDEVSDSLLDRCPPGIPALRIVHSSAAHFSRAVLHRCDRFICLTEGTMDRMASTMSSDKLVLIHQGIDLDRFSPRRQTVRGTPTGIDLLIYSRLDDDRAPTIWQLLEELEPSDIRITVLGDGASFWDMTDRFGERITQVHFIPCTSIQNFLTNFDVVISSARGVMEALAMGIPALCGGFEYAGPVLRENIAEQLTVNITGYGMGIDPAAVQHDVTRSAGTDPGEWRRLAEDYCSVRRFADRLLETAQSARLRSLAACS